MNARTERKLNLSDVDVQKTEILPPDNKVPSLFRVVFRRCISLRRHITRAPFSQSLGCRVVFSSLFHEKQWDLFFEGRNGFEGDEPFLLLENATTIFSFLYTKVRVQSWTIKNHPRLPVNTRKSVNILSS